MLSVPPEDRSRPDLVLSPGEVDIQVSKNREDEEREASARDIFDAVPPGSPSQPIPEGLGTRVQKWMRYFQTAGRERFETYLERSGKYSELMRKILSRYGLPGDLIYLALIESGFSPKAYSVAKAAGPWQFIAETGRRYGLHVDWWADERRDYEKSTHAAASYLKDLYGMFDSWQLAAAAYNAGEGRIQRAVGRYKLDSYAELVQAGRLPQETRDYVPKMLAALTIAKEPDKYGFGNVQYQDPLEFEKVVVPGGTDLAALGRIIGLPYDTLREWNPELRRFCTPPNRATYELRLPKGYKAIADERMEDIRASAKITFILHTVTRGETLDSLAEEYNTSAANILDLNGLKGKKNGLRRSARLVIPVTGLDPADAVPGKELSTDQLQMAHMKAEDGRRGGKKGKATVRGGNGGGRIVVRKGDTLYGIAKRAGVSVAALEKANRLRPGAGLKVGARLRIPGGGGSEASSAETAGNDAGEDASRIRRAKNRASETDPEKRPLRHIVRKGETLGKIAKSYGVTVEELSDRNRLKAGQKLRRGRVLFIPAES